MKPTALTLSLLLLLTACAAPPSPPPEAEQDVAADGSSPAAVEAASPGDSTDKPLTDAEAIEHWRDDYAGLLLTCVTRDGRVKYDALKPQRVLLNRLVTDLASARKFDSPAQQQAHLINAYNLLVIAALAQREPPVSPGRIGGFFNLRRFEVGGEKLTLNEIRAKAVALGDARSHLAMVQGAIGAPPLRTRPFRPDGLENQLNFQCRRFVNDRRYVTTIGRTVLASSIFGWYQKDFEAAPFGSIRAFMEVFAEPGSTLARRLAGEDTETVIDMLEFNWAINSPD